MTQYNFGTGNLFAIPTGGGAPLKIGALQEVSVEFSGDIKMLYGQYQFPLDVARGKTKIDGKIGSGDIDIPAYNTTFFGQTTAVGETKQAVNEAGTPASTTVTVANGATFYLDLGVYYVATGLPLKQVVSAPATGQYTVSVAGLYTFAAGDTGKAMLFNYLYLSTTTGNTLTIGNPLMGTTPKFQLASSQVYQGKTFTMVLYSVVIDKFSMPLKMDDHTHVELTYTAQANSAGNVGIISTTGGA